MRPVKKVNESEITHSQLMMPQHGNPSPDGRFQNVNGGIILNLIDNVAGIVSLRHCRSRTVTASIDQMEFLHPVRVGDLLIIKAAVNWVGRTSLEIGVRVETENLFTGETNPTGRAYLTFVAVDNDGKPIDAPMIEPTTLDEKRRFREAQERRERRLNHRKQTLQNMSG